MNEKINNYFFWDVSLNSFLIHVLQFFVFDSSQFQIISFLFCFFIFNIFTLENILTLSVNTSLFINNYVQQLLFHSSNKISYFFRLMPFIYFPSLDTLKINAKLRTLIRNYILEGNPSFKFSKIMLHCVCIYVQAPKCVLS